MSITNINIGIDSEVESQAQSVLASLGIDMTEAVDLFLRQTIRQQSIPFGVAAPMEELAEEDEFFEPQNIVPKLGSLKGKIWMSDDFDAPMEEFEEQVVPVPIESMFGCMKGKIWMSDDFDAPMEEFEEYM